MSSGYESANLFFMCSTAEDSLEDFIYWIDWDGSQIIDWDGSYMGFWS